jgi:GNAT superfamily N-acetyltransferase
MLTCCDAPGTAVQDQQTARSPAQQVKRQAQPGVLNWPGTDPASAASTAAAGLGWVCARQDGDLAGFVNVAWDGGGHAFILDTLVTATARHRGIGTELVATAARHARAAGCEWLHVDFEDHLTDFYYQACGFIPTPAGLIALAQQASH